MNCRRKKIIFSIALIAIILSTTVPARIDLTGAWHPTGGGGGGNPFDQSLNTTDDVQFDQVTFGRFLLSSYGGSIDAGGDPWYLSGTSFQIAENLTVDHNITTSGYFLGDGSQLTGLPSGTPGGSDGQMQYNNSGSFAGAYYYANGNMTSSLDGTWGYYEDDTLIVIGNLSWVGVYKD